MRQLLTELIRRRSATVQELALALGLSVEATAANCAGLHDYGYVTLYGHKPDSLVRWAGIEDEWVRKMVAA